MYMRAASLTTHCHGLAQPRGGFQAVISQDQNNAAGVDVHTEGGRSSMFLGLGAAKPPLPAAFGSIMSDGVGHFFTLPPL